METIKINIPHKEYEVVIERGLFKSFGKEIRKVYKGTNISVITDRNLYNLYCHRLSSILAEENFVVRFIVVEPGEESKSMKTLEHVYSMLALNQITRSDLIVAFGGGVVGDLAGYAASTYMRGINYIQAPTSLLAQIDSSIGGKVAINLKEGKNLAGSFHQPLRVLTDPDLLESLPEKYIKDGLGEVIKYACIKDVVFFDFLMNVKPIDLLSSMDKIIHVCAIIKTQLVENDERDTGLRMILNFGHTVGHAIEKHTDYEMSHGEAVANGMLIITKNSQLLGFTEAGTYEKIKLMLEHFQISSSLNITTNDIKKYIQLDKKNLIDNINLILLKRMGEAFIYKASHHEIEKFISMD